MAMEAGMVPLIDVLLLGTGATLVMDGWSLLRRPLLGQPGPDYRLLGRWVGHFSGGRFRHASIAKAAPSGGENLLGWLVHYATGVAFAAAFLVIVGRPWLEAPSVVPALAFGIGSVVAPLFVMQPAMGAGVAASRTPDPRRARVQSLLTHVAFGLGLWISGLVLARAT